MRLRPYVYYKEGTLIPEKEEKHAGEGSWPSGHTSLGWTTALLLIDINPAATDGIMARAYEHGQSRVIAGYHWQTDVDAANAQDYFDEKNKKLVTSEAVLKAEKEILHSIAIEQSCVIAGRSAFYALNGYPNSLNVPMPPRLSVFL